MFIDLADVYCQTIMRIESGSIKLNPQLAYDNKIRKTEHLKIAW